MTDLSLWLGLAAAFAGGICLGLMFFWSLWRSVNSLRPTKPAQAMTTMLFGLVGRFILVLLGLFCILKAGGWTQALSATLGFTIVRFWVVRRALGRGPKGRLA